MEYSRRCRWCWPSEDINEKYESATASVDWIWSKVSPLAYLGSQVVAGNNYALICKGESSSEERADSMMIVTIYEDPDGKSELSNIHLLDLADFTDQ
jgi:hypothetical protein